MTNPILKEGDYVWIEHAHRWPNLNNILAISS
jgi:hypothetical protein